MGIAEESRVASAPNAYDTVIAEANRKNREELDLLDAALDEALAELEGDENLIGRPADEGK